MVKYSLTFAAGAATITGFVVATGATNFTLFALGMLTTAALMLAVYKLAGPRRLAAFFARQAGQPMRVSRRKPVTDEMIERRYDRMSRRQARKIEDDEWNARAEADADSLDALVASQPPPEVAALQPAASAPVSIKPTAVEAEVISALKNLKADPKAARAAVRAAAQVAPQEFEPLFKHALNIVQGKAAA